MLLQTMKFLPKLKNYLHYWKRWFIYMYLIYLLLICAVLIFKYHWFLWPQSICLIFYLESIFYTVLWMHPSRYIVHLLASLTFFFYVSNNYLCMLCRFANKKMILCYKQPSWCWCSLLRYFSMLPFFETET